MRGPAAVVVALASMSTASLAARDSAPTASRVSGICALTASVIRFELEDAREDEHLAEAALVAQQGILDLLQPLWDARLTERLRYLSARHRRDRAEVEVGRSTVVRERAETKLEALEQACDEGAATEGEAAVRFEELGCQLVRYDSELARIDVAFYEEVMQSTAELRSRELTTAQELIVARFDLQNAQAELKARKKRLDRCAAEPARPVQREPSESERPALGGADAGS
jgi:hypothetical protein